MTEKFKTLVPQGQRTSEDLVSFFKGVGQERHSKWERERRPNT
jgi:hypothetical protein